MNFFGADLEITIASITYDDKLMHLLTLHETSGRGLSSA